MSAEIQYIYNLTFPELPTHTYENIRRYTHVVTGGCTSTTEAKRQSSYMPLRGDDISQTKIYAALSSFKHIITWLFDLFSFISSACY